MHTHTHTKCLEHTLAVLFSLILNNKNMSKSNIEIKVFEILEIHLFSSFPVVKFLYLIY